MNAFLIAWRVSRFLPRSVLRGIAAFIAWAAWARRAKPARRLADNLHRVTGLEGDELRRLTRRGMASAARYYAETLELGRMTPAQIDARVRLEGFDEVESILARDTGTVAVLSHSGNWDIIGAYAARHIIPVTAVAEVLEPREVFDEFVALREGVGMRILGHEGGSTFRRLISITRSERMLVCLLSDRDLSGDGVEVRMWDQPVRVAPGPAALAVTAKTCVIPVYIHYERVHGRRRRVGRSRWGLVLSFGPALWPEDFPGDSRVQDLSQAWVDYFADRIREHPEDWHMLQRFGWIA